MPTLDQPSHLDDPVAVPAVVRRLSAVSFLDIVSYSTLMAENPDLMHHNWMHALHEIIRPAAQHHHGRIVKSTGDGVLAEFPSARDAVAWAEAVQLALLSARTVPGAPTGSIAARIAVHLDEVFVTDDDIYGPGVNIAARLQEHASPGGIVLSETVLNLVRDSLNRSLRSLGLLNLKNIP